MERRDLLKGLSAAGVLSLLDPGYLAVRAAFLAGEQPTKPLPKRPYGRAKDMISVLGFGGIIVKDETPEQAARFVAEAFDRGVNYFDVAPSYGNAQEKLGPALKPYRDRCFLACKTNKRDAAGAQHELDESLRLLQTDHFDLYQLHGVTKVAEVEQAFGPGGAMEVILKAKERGTVRYLGFSAHSEEAAHAAMDRYDFDSILFPLGFPTWLNEFGPSVHKRAVEGGKAVLALKAMARRKWSVEPKDRKWDKAWYEPFDQVDQASLGLRFTNGLPATAMIPPGHWELFKLAVELVQAGALTPLNDAERQLIAQIARDGEPIFERKA